MKSTVTIIMATYNRAHFIVETLSSIQNQTFVDWECLIIDDGSTDNTAEIINDYLKKDNRFQFYSRPNHKPKGPSACRNYGIEKAKGDYIIFFDDDDIVHPQNLELCVLELRDGDISFCRYICNGFFDDFDYVFDYSKKYTSFYIDKKDVEKIVKNEILFICCAVMWRAACFEKNQFNENLIYAEDWELYSKMIASGFKGISIDKILFYGRKHAHSSTGKFYRNDFVRRKSYSDSILLVVQNIKEKQLFTYSLKRYFIAVALDFEEYNLYEKIINVMDLSTFEKIKWQIFYAVLPLRLKLYRMHKVIKKKI